MISGAYIVVVLGILLAKGVGFLRDMIFAGVFGTSVESDIYFQVFGLVNLIFTGIGVALSTLVIKNLNKSENVGAEQSYAASFLRKSALCMTAFSVLIAVFAKPIISLILPDISGESLELAVKMMYAMAPCLVFSVVAYIISGILQNKKVYFITSVMSLPFNVAIIISLLVKNVSVFTVGIVTTIGWFLHIAIQLPAFFKNGYSFLTPVDKRVKKQGISGEMIWIFISNMMFQACVYIDRAFVNSTEGMVSIFNYASNLFITIASVFVIAMSTVIFPSISKNYEEGNIEYVKKTVSHILVIMSAIFIPFVLVTFCFGEDVIRLLYERGTFTSESTKGVALMFALYSLGVLGYVCQELLNKVLYLAEKYKYTVFGTLGVIALNVVLNVAIKNFVSSDALLLGLPIKTVLTALSTAVLFTAYGLFVVLSIQKAIGKYLTGATLINILKVLFSGVAALVVYILFNTFAKGFTHGYISFIIVLLACGVTYGATLLLTGVFKELLKVKKDEN